MKKLNTIMLIDDNEDDNFYHQVILDEASASEHIEVAESGMKALEFLSKGENIPDLIFLDINMPAMNGWEFLDEYAKLDVAKQAKVVIIMLTTSLNPADALRAGSIKYIKGFETKPLSKEMIKNIMDKYF